MSRSRPIVFMCGLFQHSSKLVAIFFYIYWSADERLLRIGKMIGWINRWMCGNDLDKNVTVIAWQQPQNWMVKTNKKNVDNSHWLSIFPTIIFQYEDIDSDSLVITMSCIFSLDWFFPSFLSHWFGIQHHIARYTDSFEAFAFFYLHLIIPNGFGFFVHAV